MHLIGFYALWDNNEIYNCEIYAILDTREIYDLVASAKVSPGQLTYNFASLRLAVALNT